MSNIYQFYVEDSNLDNISLKKYNNYVILIVNTASKCGFNYQLSDLEKLYEKYKDQKFIVLGFPCDQFLRQEFNNNEQILDFCQTKFKVSFPIMAKVKVNGDNAIPLYKYLKQMCPGILGTEVIKWNFTKFLINREGLVIKRFAPITKVKAIEEEMLKLI
jgi:glutathione peroxidase